MDQEQQSTEHAGDSPSYVIVATTQQSEGYNPPTDWAAEYRRGSQPYVAGRSDLPERPMASFPTRSSYPKIDPTPRTMLPSRRGEPVINASANIGRNDPCWCGSGKKYKKCHMGRDAPG